MSVEVQGLPNYQLKTLDGRTIVIKQSVSRHGYPCVIVETYSADIQLQSTVKIGYKDINNLKLALQSFADAMLEGMCDY